jgi:hypothetical protein
MSECVESLASAHHWAKGTGSRPGATLRAELGDGLFREVSALLGFLELLLGLAELGQVKSGDLLLQSRTKSVLPAQLSRVKKTHSLFDLSLVSLDLLLQLVDKVLHPLVVLAVLLALEAELLNAALRLAQVLLGISVAALLTVKLVLELAYSLFELLNGLLSSLECAVLSLVQSDLELLDLDLEGLAEFLLGLGVVLLGAQLVGETGGVNHCLLGLLLGVLGLVQKLIQIGLRNKRKICIY